MGLPPAIQAQAGYRGAAPDGVAEGCPLSTSDERSAADKALRVARGRRMRSVKEAGEHQRQRHQRDRRQRARREHAAAHHAHGSHPEPAVLVGEQVLLRLGVTRDSVAFFVHQEEYSPLTACLSLPPPYNAQSNMLAKVFSGALVGLDGQLIEVEVDLLPGLPAVNVVGLPDTMVQEARERVRSAVRNSGCFFPTKRITVNLAPADIRKEGPSFDLPIAVGAVLGWEEFVADTSGALFLGELSLDGRLRSTHGILPMVTLARDHGLDEVYVPAADAAEAALVEGVTIYAVETFSGLIRHLRGEEPIAPYVRSGPLLGEAPTLTSLRSSDGTDFAEVRGQEHVKRALEVAAAGGHNLLMIGPAGAGKTLLARALPSILPSMTPEEALMVTRIYSVAGLLPPDPLLITRRPFRAPHHPISQAGLVGGGRQPRPGEISLSHLAVLESPQHGTDRGLPSD